MAIIGIDLGTSNSAAAVLRGGRPVIIPSAGTDMDQNLVDYIADKFKLETGVDVGADRRSLVRLRESAEVAKIELLSTTTHINLPYIRL